MESVKPLLAEAITVAIPADLRCRLSACGGPYHSYMKKRLPPRLMFTEEKVRVVLRRKTRTRSAI
jgi:hypothetical protein